MVEPRGRTNRRALIGYLILTGAIALTFFLNWRNSETLDADRLERIEIVNDVLLANCLEIEQLKTFRRQEAEDSHADAEADFKLLGIPLTREVRDRLNQERAEVLRRYKAEPCPRNPVPE